MLELSDSNRWYMIKMNETKLCIIDYYILVIDVKSLWDMDSQEGSKNAFVVGSKFDHLSPDHASSLQKKVSHVTSIVNSFYLGYFHEKLIVQ